MTGTNADRLAYNTKNAAKACDLPRFVIDAAIKRGDLRATKSGRSNIILREDLYVWLRKCLDAGSFPQIPVSQEDRERMAVLNRGRKK